MFHALIWEWTCATARKSKHSTLVSPFVFFLRAAEVSPIDTEGTCNLPRTWDFHGILCEMKPVQHLLHLFKALKIAFLRAACHQGASVTPSMAEMP